MTQEEREIEARKIAGNDQMLFNRIMKYGIHKPIRENQYDDMCVICEYAEGSLIHLKVE